MLRRAWLRNLYVGLSNYAAKTTRRSRVSSNAFRLPTVMTISASPSRFFAPPRRSHAQWSGITTLEPRQLLSGVNEAPTAVTFSDVTTALAENTSTSSAIELATISVTDDGIGTNVLSLAGPDATSFEIVGSTLRLKAGVILNHEAKQFYAVTVNADDASVGSAPDASAAFSFSVLDINEPPTKLNFSGSTSVAENLPAGTLLGTLSTLDPDAGNTFTYALVFDPGDPARSESFQIVGNQLRTNVSFDFEARRSYLVWIRTTDQDGLFREEGIFVNVTNVNEPPTAVVITPRVTTLSENTSTTLAEIVATFTVTDDSLGTETLALSGPHQDYFFIAGFNLLRKAGIALDFEATPTLSVTINANDPTVGSTPDASQTYTLSLTNLNEAPTALSLSNSTVAEHLPAGTIVGTLLTTDQDAGSTFTYSLAGGVGDSGNTAFQIVGNQLVTTRSFDFESQAGYSVRVRTTDQGGLSFENFVTVMVTNVNEAPTAVVLEKLVPEGPEFRVNATTVSVQTAPSVAVAPDGSFIVAWQSQQDGSGTGVYAQRYSALGLPVGAEFQVNITTVNVQDMAQVAMSSDGSFIVTWRSLGQDGSGGGVYGRRYSAAGVPLSGEFQINTTTAGSQDFHSVAASPDGSFVVTWQTPNQDGSSLGVYARRYSSAGVPIGGEFLVNTTTASNQAQPSVATDSVGNFVIVWSSLFQEGGADTGIYGQRYNASGARVGGEFHINTTTEHSQNNPSIATAADGSFVVTWMSIHQDGSSNGIYARRYNAAGAALGDEFRVNTTTANSQQFPVVDIAPDGSFLVSWTSLEQDGSGPGVYGQRFNASGDRVGEQFRVNTETFNSQFNPSMASDANGNVVIAWTSIEQDGSQHGVYAQRYKTIRPVLTLPENANTAAPIELAPITVTDEGLGTNNLYLSGTHASFFELIGTTLRVKAGTVLDFEATPSLSVTVNVDDPSVGAPVDASVVFTLALTDVNEPPTAHSQSVTVTEDGSAQISLHGSDPETVETNLTFTITSLPSNGTLLDSNGNAVTVGEAFTGSPTLTYVPRAEATSGLIASFTFEVRDPVGLVSAPATVAINVTQAVVSGDVTIDSEGIVRIGGTSADDTLVVSSSSGLLNVSLNGLLISNSIPLSLISELRAWTYEGNDVIDASSLSLQTVLFGGSGDDALIGGSGTDVVFGGDGDDTITGSAGNDFLAGGADSDRIVGSAGHDVLVAGTIGSSLTLEDLKGVLAGWVMGAVQTWDDSGSDESVLMGSDFDKLTGSSGADWFIIGQNDIVTDFRPERNTGDLVTHV
jgi:Ca2+-binding RTX toxin-like protein